MNDDSSEWPATADLVARAWLLRGLANTPGIMVAAHSHIAFFAEDQPVFVAPESEVEVRWPVIEMSGGARFTLKGETHRVSFVRPNGAADVAVRSAVHFGGSIGAAGGLVEIGRLMGSIREGRAAGKAWKAYLS